MLHSDTLAPFSSLCSSCRLLHSQMATLDDIFAPPDEEPPTQHKVSWNSLTLPLALSSKLRALREASIKSRQRPSTAPSTVRARARRRASHLHMTTGDMMPTLSQRPRLLELHARHMEHVGRLSDELDAEVGRTPNAEWHAGIRRSLDVFASCGPLHERGGKTPTARLHSGMVPTDGGAGLQQVSPAQ